MVATVAVVGLLKDLALEIILSGIAQSGRVAGILNQEVTNDLCVAVNRLTLIL